MHQSRHLFILRLLTIILLSAMILLPDLIASPSSPDTSVFQSEKDKIDLLIVGLGVSDHKVRDEGVSPLTYRGPVLQIDFGNIDWKKKRRWQIIGKGGVGITSGSGTIQQYGQYNFYFSLHTNYLLNTNLLKNHSWRLYAGPDFNFTGNTRLNQNLFNASFTYDFVGSLNAGVRLEYDFGWPAGRTRFLNIKRRQRILTAAFQWNIPVMHIFQRPEYAVIDDFTDGNSLYSGQGDLKLTSYGQIIRINMELSLLYHLQNGNLLQFQYGFDGIRIDEGYNILSTVHRRLSFGFLFRLNHNRHE
ncbi:MAG TPA: hypothetical protein DDY13_06940 [Cytophagales bacterium]|jgi:hypothetical protein|nr:hypothetical protein [Cytophagales bacterium]